jgi:hypothetical protein
MVPLNCSMTLNASGASPADGVPVFANLPMVSKVFAAIAGVKVTSAGNGMSGGMEGIPGSFARRKTFNTSLRLHPMTSEPPRWQYGLQRHFLQTALERTHNPPMRARKWIEPKWRRDRLHSPNAKISCGPRRVQKTWPFVSAGIATRWWSFGK